MGNSLLPAPLRLEPRRFLWKLRSGKESNILKDERAAPVGCPFPCVSAFGKGLGRGEAMQYHWRCIRGHRHDSRKLAENGSVVSRRAGDFRRGTCGAFGTIRSRDQARGGSVAG